MKLNIFTKCIGKVEMITGVGPAMPSSLTKWRNPIRPIRSPGKYLSHYFNPNINKHKQCVKVLICFIILQDFSGSILLHQQTRRSLLSMESHELLTVKLAVYCIHKQLYGQLLILEEARVLPVSKIN